MDLMKECAGRIKRDGDKFQEIKNGTDNNEKIKAVNSAISNLNITKTELGNLTREDISRLLYLLQNLGIELDICEHYRIFFSGKNKKYHQICEGTRENIKTNCFGDKRKCEFDFFDERGNKIKQIEKNKKRKWDKL
jgi:hypothetical protein